MKFLVSLSILLMSSSCASAQWVDEQVSFENQRYRICTKEIDGEEYHLRGFCRKYRQYKHRPILKDLTRVKIYFCPFEDKECLLKLSGKTLK